MALYPTLSQVPYSSPRMLSYEYKTLISTFDDMGREQRKKKSLYHKHIVELNYKNISKAKARILFQFFINRKGSYESFHWIDDYSEQYVREYFGTGDASTTTYDLPGKNISGYDVFGDSIEYDEAPDATGVGDYYIVKNGGSDGGDQAIFFTAPPNGKRLTIDFTGQLKIKCRFQDDMMSFQQFWDILYTSSVKLKGLLLDST